jgi:nucleotide-binding universal stress UspA family protein
MEESANKVLDSKKKEIKKRAGLEIRTKLMAGHISNSIIDFAVKEKIDLIIIGNVGRSGMSKIRTLGSVSRSVSESFMSRDDHSLTDFLSSKNVGA